MPESPAPTISTSRCSVLTPSLPCSGVGGLQHPERYAGPLQPCEKNVTHRHRRCHLPGARLEIVEGQAERRTRRASSTSRRSRGRRRRPPSRPAGRRPRRRSGRGTSLARARPRSAPCRGTSASPAASGSAAAAPGREPRRPHPRARATVARGLTGDPVVP